MRTAPPPDLRGWREAGRRLGTPLERYSAVLIVGRQLDIAAAAARGITEVLSGYREVIIADLVGGLPLVAELGNADAEGVSDSFAFGISLARIAQKSAYMPNVSVMPSGTDRVDREEIFRSGRWRRFADLCREQGQLLLVVAPSDAPSLEALAANLDGVVSVGEDVSLDDGVRVLYHIREPAEEVWTKHGARGRRRVVIAATAFVVLAAVVAGFVALRYAQRPTPAPQPSAVEVSLPPVPAAPAIPLPGNVADSSQAAAYAVELLSANTSDGANFELRRFRASLPAATVVPVLFGAERSTWYKVVVGAFTDVRQADSLLRVVRARGVVADSAGRMLHAPLALLIDSVAARGAVARVVNEHVSRGVPAYALVQPDGRALVYAGAFTRAEEAEILIQQLRAAGLTPALMYRTGRAL